MTRQATRAHKPPGSLVGFDGSDYYIVNVDSEGNLLTKSAFDFIADFEITGTSVLNRGFTPGAGGDNTLVTIGATERIKLYKVTLSPSADVTGEVYLKVGSTKVATVYSPMAGGQYVLVSCFPDFEYGGLDEDLILNLPSAITCSVNVAYEVV